MRYLTDREQAEVAVIAAAVVRKFGDSGDWSIIRDPTHDHYGHLHLGERCFGRVIGSDGVIGSKGEKGDKGDTGPVGETREGIAGPKGDPGDDGAPGLPGVDGKDGEKGDKGDKGEKGDKGDKGDAGQDGRDGVDGLDGAPGADGAPGLKGDPGIPGTNGTNGTNGINGQPGISAYEVAVNNGFSGTQAQWLASLVGTSGVRSGIVATVASTGQATWTFPTPFPSGVIPIINATALQSSGVIAEGQILSVTNTQCTILVTRTAAITVALLGLTILQVAAAASTTVHIIAVPPT